MAAESILADIAALRIISRKEATIQGLRHYYTGKPCINGHHSRKSLSGSCIECNRIDAEKRRKIAAKPPRVLLLEDEKKRRKAESDRLYRIANPETADQKALRAMRQTVWRENNRELSNSFARKYYAADPKKHLAWNKRWAENNPEKKRDTYLNWAAKNQDWLKEYRAGYHAANKPYRILQSRRWKEDNADAVREYGREYRRLNPNFAKMHRVNRRARIIGNGGKLTIGVEQKLMRLQRGKCACCGVSLKKSGHHLDHVQSLAKGGRNDDLNVQLLCPPCNRSKHAKHPVDFMQERGFLL